MEGRKRRKDPQQAVLQRERLAENRGRQNEENSCEETENEAENESAGMSMSM